MPKKSSTKVILMKKHVENMGLYEHQVQLDPTNSRTSHLATSSNKQRGSIGYGKSKLKNLQTSWWKFQPWYAQIDFPHFDWSGPLEFLYEREQIFLFHWDRQKREGFVCVLPLGWRVINLVPEAQWRSDFFFLQILGQNSEHISVLAILV